MALLKACSATDFSQLLPYRIVMVGAQVHVGPSVQSLSRSVCRMCVLSSLMTVFLSNL